MVAQTAWELIKQASNILQNDTVEETVDQLAWLFFLKYSESREAALQRAEKDNSADKKTTPVPIPNDYCWSRWIEKVSLPDVTNRAIEDEMQEKILPYFKGRFQLDLAYTHPPLVRFKALLTWLEELDTLSIGKDDPDIIVSLYSGLLQLLTPQYKKDGVFATPYPVAFFMAQVLNPQKGEYIYDPACGIGSLLLTAYGNSYSSDDMLTAQIMRGNNKNARILQIARMNLLLHGINTTYIREGNPLTTQSFDGLFKDYFDDGIKELNMIINHPPLGDYCKPPEQKHAPEQLKRVDEWFLRYNMSQLRRFPGSRCGMVISERTLKGTEGKTAKKEGVADLRRRLFRDYTIQMIVRLPFKTFPDSNEKTFLLFFTGEQTQYQRTLHYDLAKKLGIMKSQKSKKHLLNVADFQDLLIVWKKWKDYLDAPDFWEAPLKTDYQWIETYKGWKDDDQEQHYPYSLLTKQEPPPLPEPIDPCILVEKLVKDSNKFYEIAQNLRARIYELEES